MKNIFKILTVCLLIALMLTGCTPNNKDLPDEADTTAPAVSDSDTTPALTLFDANTSYAVIRAEECDTETMNMAANFRLALKDMTTFKVDIKTDWIRRDETPDPEALEILVANTNRPESDQVLESIGFNDYAIKVVGKKLVIAAHKADTLQAALDYALQKLIKVADDGTVTLSAEYTYQSGVSDVINGNGDLAEYKIVVSPSDSSAKDLAKELQKAIKDTCGAELKIVGAHVAASEKEFLIGNTNRAESTTMLSKLSGLEYAIAVSGSKIILGGNTNMATSLAIDAFIEKFLINDFSDVCKVPSDYNEVNTGTITLKGGEDPALAEGADLRIMSFNILAELWDTKAKATLPGREENVAAILLSYMPDVVGLQETTDLWYSLLEPKLEGVYKFASHKIPSGKTNYSTMMYNVQTTQLIECKTVVYSKGNSSQMRNLTWGRFRRISDGAEYIVTCTHWDITNDRIDAQWPENAQLIKELYEKYKLPIFATGDYNADETEQFKSFMAKTGMLDPKYKAKTINNAGKTYHDLGQKPSSSEYAIDHIPCMPVTGTELLYYNVLKCQAALDASDHCPIYIDVKLK